MVFAVGICVVVLVAVALACARGEWRGAEGVEAMMPKCKVQTPCSPVCPSVATVQRNQNSGTGTLGDKTVWQGRDPISVNELIPQNRTKPRTALENNLIYTLLAQYA